MGTYRFRGFTLLEVIATLVLLGILSIFVISSYNAPDVDTIVDESILKSAIRQTIMRAMSDLSTANWNIVVANRTAQVKKDTTIMSSYNLQKYSGSFTISFNNLGQPQSSPALPYSITIESETGFVP